jgi:hypothetical protein
MYNLAYLDSNDPSYLPIQFKKPNGDHADGKPKMLYPRSPTDPFFVQPTIKLPDGFSWIEIASPRYPGSSEFVITPTLETNNIVSLGGGKIRSMKGGAPNQVEIIHIPNNRSDVPMRAEVKTVELASVFFINETIKQSYKPNCKLSEDELIETYKIDF